MPSVTAREQVRRSLFHRAFGGDQRKSGQHERIVASMRHFQRARHFVHRAAADHEPHRRLPFVLQVTPHPLDQAGLRQRATGRQRARRVGREERAAAFPSASPCASSKPRAALASSVGNCAVCSPSERIIRVQPGAIRPPTKQPSARNASSVVAVPNVAISRVFAGKRRVRADHAGPAVAAERVRRRVAIGHAALLCAGADRRARQLRPVSVEQRGDPCGDTVRPRRSITTRHAASAELTSQAGQRHRARARRSRFAYRPAAPAPT